MTQVSNSLNPTPLSPLTANGGVIQTNRQRSRNSQIPHPTAPISATGVLPSTQLLTLDSAASWNKTIQLVEGLARFKQKKSCLHYFVKPFKLFLRLFGFFQKKSCPEEAYIRYLNNFLKVSPDSPKGTTLDLLKATIQTFKEMKDPNLSGAIKTLQKAYKYAEAIERLKRVKQLKANDSGIKTLIKEQIKDLSKATSDQPFLMELQWKEGKDKSAGWLKVIKNEQGNYDVQVISTDPATRLYSKTWVDQQQNERHSPCFSFQNVSLEQIKEAIPHLVKLQLEREEKEEQDSLGFFSKMSLIFDGSENGKAKNEDLEQNPSPIHLLQLAFGKDPEIGEEPDAIRSGNANSFKELMLFFKGHLPKQQYRAQKLRLELQALNHAFKQGNKFLKHPAFRQAIIESAYRLEKEINKNGAGLDASQQERLTVALKNILVKVEEAEKKYSKQGLKPLIRGRWSKDFQQESTRWARERVKGSSSVKASFAPNFQKLDFNSQQTLWDSTSHAIKELERLYTAGDYRSLEIGLIDLIKQLPPPHHFQLESAQMLAPAERLEFWQGLSTQQSKEWQKRFLHLSKLILEAYRMQELEPTPADLLVANCYLTTLSNDLSAHRNELNQINRVSDDLIRFFKSNPYFRVSSPFAQSQVEVIIDYQTKLTDRYGYSLHTDFGYSEKIPYDCPIGTQNDSRTWAYQTNVISSTLMHEGKNLEWFEGIFAAIGGFKNIANSFGDDLTEMSRDAIKRKLANLLFAKVKQAFSRPAPIRGGKRQPPKWSTNKMMSGVAIVPGIFATKFQVSEWRFLKEGENHRKAGRLVTDEMDEKVIRFGISTTNSDDALTPSGIEARSDSPKIALLRHMQSKEARLEQTLTTFNQHTELLDDCSCQRLFELNLLSQGKLFHIIQNKPAVFQDLVLFVEENLRLAIASNNVPRAAFLLSIRETIRHFVGQTGLDENIKNELLRNLGTHEKSLQDSEELINSSASLENKQLIALTMLPIYRQRIELGYINKEQLTREELQKIISLQFILQAAPIPAKYANPAALKDASFVMFQLAKPIDRAMSDSSFRQFLLSRLLPTGTPLNRVKGRYPRYFVKDYMVDLNQGVIYHKNRRNGQLPEKVLNDSDFSTVASNLQDRNCLITLCKSKKHPEIVEYNLSDKHKTHIVQTTGRPLLIQRQMPIGRRSKKMDFVSQTQHESFPTELQLLSQNNQVWRDSADSSKLFIYSANGEKLLYRVSLKYKEGRFTFSEIKREADGLRLLPVRLQSNVRHLKQLGLFDSQGNVQLWGDSHWNLKEVSYPRLMMADGSPLSYRISGKKIVCLNAPKKTLSLETLPLRSEFEEDNKQFLLEYLPASFTHYHRLEEKGKPAQVLIPLKKFHVGKEIKETEQRKILSWSGSALVDHDFQKEPADVLQFEVDTIGHTLQSKDKRALLYLAYLFMVHKRYDKAAELLKRAETELPLTASQKEIYQWIEAWQDSNPAATSLRLKATIALLHKQLPTDPEKLAMLIQKLKSDECNYQRAEAELPHSLRLSEEEKERLQEVLDRTGASVFEVSFTPQTTEAAKKVNTELKKPKDLSSSVIAGELYLAMSSSVKDNLSLDPDIRLKKSFAALYDKIYRANGDSLADYKKFVLSLQPKTPTGQALRFYLRALIHHKENSPSIAHLEFPRSAIPSYFKFIRLCQAPKKTREIVNLFTYLERSIPEAAQTANKDPNVTGGWQNQGINLVQAQKLSIGMNDLNSPEELFKKAKQGELNHKIEQANRHLDSHPVAKAPEYAPLLAYSQYVLSSAAEPKPVPQAAPDGSLSEAESRQFLDNYAERAEEQNPAAAKFARDLSQDVKVFLDQAPAGEYQISKEIAKSWAEKAGADIQELQQNKKQAHLEILRLIGRNDQTIQSLKSFRDGSIPTDLIGLFQKGNLKKVNELYRLQLSAEEITELGNQLAIYMRATVDIRQGQRVQDYALQLANKATDISAEEAQELVNLRWTQRYFDPTLDHALVRAMLTIEFFTGFVLRQNQVETIQEILMNPGQVRQLGMGQGKSSVILPVLLNHFADGFHLPVGMIPDVLYAIVAEDLDASSKAMLGQGIYRFEYSREAASDIDALTEIYGHLSSAVKRKQLVLTTRTFLLSYRNKFNELQRAAEDPKLSIDQKQDFDARIAIMGQTLTLLKERGIGLADEIDTILNGRDELNYAIGEMEPVSSQKVAAGLKLFGFILNWQNSGEARLKNYSDKILPTSKPVLEQKL